MACQFIALHYNLHCRKFQIMHVQYWCEVEFPVLFQDQYAFIHDALSDHITCGDTSVMAHELRGAIVDMNKKDGTGKSGFEQQFEVL